MNQINPMLVKTSNLIVIIAFALFLKGCNQCEKIYLTASEKDWVGNYKPGFTMVFNSNECNIYTLVVVETNNSFTQCNKFELSEFQSEVYSVQAVFKSRNRYNGKNCLITLIKSRKEAIEPTFVVAGLGSIENRFERPRC